MKTFTIGLEGQAGGGVASSIALLAKIFSKKRYFLYSPKEYSSQIKGGHNFHILVVSNEEVGAESGEIDFLIAPYPETLERHGERVGPNGTILCFKNIIHKSGSAKFVELNFEVKNKSNPSLALLIGAAASAFGISNKELEEAIKVQFSHHPGLCENYLKEAQEGFELYSKKGEKKIVLPEAELKSKITTTTITGNDAVTFGALKAGITFHAQYPMTPVSAILHNLAKEATKNPELKVMMAEDEISVINMALGASYAGARAMVASSGGGFALMVESLGLAGMGEIPLVIIEGQRPGPATGLPTKTEQGDLKFVLSAGTGDFPKVVIAPKTIEECYTETKRAFYLAEKYQLPVIVIIDKHLAESYKTINLDQEENQFEFDYKNRFNMLSEVKPSDLNKDGLFKRYASGNLQRTIPGTPNGIYTCAGDEHDEVGHITEDAELRNKMMRRRMEKLPQILLELPVPKIIGPEKANCTLVVWGSTYEAAVKAAEEIKTSKINVLSLTYMHPFNADAVKKILSASKKMILVENNYSGQLGELIAEKTGIMITDKILKSDGTTFTINELIKKVSEITKKHLTEN